MGRKSRLKKERRAALEMIGLRRKLPPGVELRNRNADEGKLSAALLDLITPERTMRESLEEFRLLTTLAVTAWNISTVQTEDGMAILESFWKEKLDPEMCAPLESHLRKLIDRKRELHPHDSRFIVEWDVQRVGDDFFVNVASSDLRPPLKEPRLAATHAGQEES